MIRSACKVLAHLAVVFCLLGSPAFVRAQAQDAPQPKTGKRPNILWIIAEDFGPHLGCFGAKEVWTPNLDKLAAQGMRFTRCFTTAPVCSPSRSAFMTGMYQTTIGAHNHRSHRDDNFRLPEGVNILPDWLREAGYFTGNIRLFPMGIALKGTGKTDWNFLYKGKAFDTDKWDDLKQKQPFYAQVNFVETHRTFSAPQKADPNKVEVPPYYPDHPLVRADWAAYLDSATELDRKVGVILTLLAEQSLLEDTIIIFFGDNGQAHVRGKQFCYDSGLHVPLIIRWPANFPMPKGYRRGGVSDQLLAAIDISATTLSFAGMAKPAKMQGRVFLGDKTEPPREYVFGARDRCDETVDRIRTVRDKQYRLIKNFMPERPLLQPNRYKEGQYPVVGLLRALHKEGKLDPLAAFLVAAKRPPEELYDLQTDPHETKNLVDSPQHQQVLMRLRQELARWIESSNDQGRIPEPPEILQYWEKVQKEKYQKKTKGSSSSRGDETEKLPAVPLFSRHVVPLFSRLGCNAGTCHGAVKGQNGFRLTLFGADPALDHERLLREFAGRRVNFQHPDASLLLRKAVAGVPHEGGKRFEVGSPEYQLLRAWIVQGALLDDPAKSAAPRLTVTPPRRTLKPGESLQLRVRADFADGSTEDVTALCSFEPRDRTVADVDGTGKVTAIALGDTVLLARYRGQPVMAQVLIPGEPKGSFPQVAEHNFIDKHILAKLRLMNVLPAELCDDATFLRRVSVDVTGALPAPDEVRAFLADQDPAKRAKKIEELLARPGHATLWATRFCDVLKPANFDTKAGLAENASARRFYEWLRARLRENTPYDQLVERILLATSREGREAAEWVSEVKNAVAEDVALNADLANYAKRQTLDLYWQRTQATGVKGALQVAHAFLGLRMECAQCHRHPHDVWQQDDLLSFANFFMAVGTGSDGKSATPDIAKEIDNLTRQAKESKDQAKKLSDMAKDKSLPKEESAKLQKQAKELGEQVKALETTAKQIKSAEVRILAKANPASVTSTLGSQKSATFRLLGEKQNETVPVGRIGNPSHAAEDPRAMVMAWLRKPENPYFARAIVNRVWAHYFGRGIVDPPDQLSPLNPASHPELLDELCADFIKHGYDLKHLHRRILLSRTYQQSAQTNTTSKLDTSNYASFYLRRLPAEVLVDAINHATAGKEVYPPELLRSAVWKTCCGV